jgi:diguanylate cyclase (GGDEF)-like protein
MRLTPPIRAIPGHPAGFRGGALLLAGGAVLAVSTILVPHSPDTPEVWAWVIAGACAIVAAALWLGAEHFPSWVLALGAMFGSVVVSAGVYASSDPDAGLVASHELLYGWVILYGAYFLSAKQTALLVGFASALYAVVLVAVPDPGSSAWISWLMLAASLSAFAILVQRLRQYSDRLVAKLSDEGRVDPLTKIYNRRAFDETWGVELERSRRSNEPVCLIVADLDDFKRYNDELGHPAGDRALSRVAVILGEHRRAVDTVARLGGEEFAIVAPNCERRDGERIAEQIRVAVERAFGNERVPLTMSLGVVAFPISGEHDDDLIHAADEALYEAKRAGRNRIASGPDQTPASAHLDPVASPF